MLVTGSVTQMTNLLCMMHADDLGKSHDGENNLFYGLTFSVV